MGDEIVLSSSDDASWWMGHISGTSQENGGWFPADCVLLPSQKNENSFQGKFIWYCYGYCYCHGYGNYYSHGNGYIYVYIYNYDHDLELQYIYILKIRKICLVLFFIYM